MNLCPLCKSIHDKSHSIINYDNKNYICNKHNEIFVKYCEDCKIDLCLSCLNEHKSHKLISYEDELIDIKELRNKMDNLNKVINKFKKNLEDIINKLKKLQNNLDTYYNINNEILKNYEINKIRYYNLLISLKNINNNINDEIKRLKDEYDLNQLLDLYNKINNDYLKIEIQYKLNKNEKFRVFRKNNKNEN